MLTAFTVMEVGMADASDTAHLDYATADKRVLVSFDQDMTRLHHLYLEMGKAHAGIIFIQPHLQGEAGIGKIVKKLIECYDKDNLDNELLFLS